MKRVIALAVLLALVGGGFAGFVGEQIGVAQAAPPDTNYNRASDMKQVQGGGLRQKDLVTLLRALRNRVWGITANGGADLSVATTVAQVRTNSIINYQINGKTYGKASTDNFCTLSGTALGLTTASYFRFEIDSTGACSVTQGPIGTVQSGTLNGTVIMPDRSANKATLGVLLVGGQVFTPGTTTTAASATVVYTNGDPDLIDALEP